MDTFSPQSLVHPGKGKHPNHLLAEFKPWSALHRGGGHQVKAPDRIWGVRHRTKVPGCSACTTVVLKMSIILSNVFPQPPAVVPSPGSGTPPPRDGCASCFSPTLASSPHHHRRPCSWTSYQERPDPPNSPPPNGILSSPGNCPPPSVRLTCPHRNLSPFKEFSIFC